jgi:hypothetical protein
MIEAESEEAMRRHADRIAAAIRADDPPRLALLLSFPHV